MKRITTYVHDDILAKARILKEREKLKYMSTYFNKALDFYNTYVETGLILDFCKGGKSDEKGSIKV